MHRNEQEVRRVGDLEIDEDMVFQKRSWRVQTLGRVLIVAFVLAGLAGLFGGGGFAKKTEQFGDMQVEYRRFLRAHAPSEIIITFSSRAGRSEPVPIAFDAAFFESFQVEKITPEPRAESLGKGAVVYEFARSDHEFAPITVRLKAVKMGVRTTTITAGTNAPIIIKTFVFP